MKKYDPAVDAVLRRHDGKGILILGDSWTQGEFEAYNHGAQSHIVVHRGLTQYLMDDGHRVHNRGVPASSNIEARNQLIAALVENRFFLNYPKPIEDPIDYIIWFTSDPLRDLHKEEDYINRVKETNSIRDLMFSLLYERYTEMNDLSKQIGIPIHCIGGWTPLLKNMEPFENLISMIPCVHELLVPGSNIPITHNAMHFFPYVRESGWISSEIKQEIIELVDEWAYTDNIRHGNPDVFYPDKEHPNRKAHHMIYEVVKEKLGLS